MQGTSSQEAKTEHQSVLVSTDWVAKSQSRETVLVSICRGLGSQLLDLSHGIIPGVATWRNLHSLIESPAAASRRYFRPLNCDTAVRGVPTSKDILTTKDLHTGVIRLRTQVELEK